MSNWTNLTSAFLLHFLKHKTQTRFYYINFGNCDVLFCIYIYFKNSKYKKLLLKINKYIYIYNHQYFNPYSSSYSYSQATNSDGSRFPDVWHKISAFILNNLFSSNRTVQYSTV